MSSMAILGVLSQIPSVDGVSLPITECPGPAFVHRHDSTGTSSYLEILDGSYQEMFSMESTINNAITPSGIRSIGFDAYTRYLYSIYAQNAKDPVFKLGRIGYDSENTGEFTVEYFDITRPEDVRVALYGGDVFSPGGVSATEPGYYLAADHGIGYAYVKIADNLGVDEMRSVKMTDLGEQRVQEFDIAFHPDSTDPTDAVFYSLDNIKEGGYDLIRFTANFETNEIRSFNMGELHLTQGSIPPFLFIEAVFFDDAGYLYFTTNDPSGHMLAVHVPLGSTTTDGMAIYYLGTLDTNWTTDGARCVGYQFPTETPQVPTVSSTISADPTVTMDMVNSTSSAGNSTTIMEPSSSSILGSMPITETEMPSMTSTMIMTTESPRETEPARSPPVTTELVSNSEVPETLDAFPELMPTMDGISTTDDHECGCKAECNTSMDCHCPCYKPCYEDCEDDADFMLKIDVEENEHVGITLDAEFNNMDTNDSFDNMDAAR